MRVIAGQWRGRTLFAPTRSARPTQDRVKQILFDILRGRVERARVLDLYAGSGALGIEALSRGAGSAVFVESEAQVRRTLERNLEKLGASGESQIIGRPVLSALPDLLRSGSRFEWILADPPYGSPEVGELISWLGGSGRGLLAPAGGFVLESRRGDLVPDRVGLLELRRERVVGDTVLRFFGLGGGTAEPAEQNGG